MEYGRLSHEPSEADIMQRLEDARLSGREIDSDTAMAIARFLGSLRSGGDKSPLRDFADTGRGWNEDLRAQYLPIYLDAEAAPDSRTMAAWLSSYLVDRENPQRSRWYGAHERTPGQEPDLSRLLWSTYTGEGDAAFTVSVPADTPAEVITGLGTSLQPLLDHYGTPIRAFLTLPDVDATAPDLQLNFEQTYVGSFETRDKTIRGLTEYDEWEAELGELCRNHAIPEDIVTIDQNELWRYILDTYDVIEGDDGLLYVFMT